MRHEPSVWADVISATWVSAAATSAAMCTGTANRGLRSIRSRRESVVSGSASAAQPNQNDPLSIASSQVGGGSWASDNDN